MNDAMTATLQMCYHRPLRLTEVTEVGCDECGEVLAYVTLRGDDVARTADVREAWAFAVVEPGAEQRVLRRIVRDVAA
jgi:hypothetical protein